MKSETILFSGRFDRPHVGHIETIGKLGKEYEKVIVVILDYEKQRYIAEYRFHIMWSILEKLSGNYELHVDPNHFATIGKDALGVYQFDVYGSGNHECLAHIKKLGHNVVYVPRSFDYEANVEYQMDTPGQANKEYWEKKQFRDKYALNAISTPSVTQVNATPSKHCDVTDKEGKGCANL